MENNKHEGAPFSLEGEEKERACGHMSVQSTLHYLFMRLQGYTLQRYEDKIRYCCLSTLTQMGVGRHVNSLTGTL